MGGDWGGFRQVEIYGLYKVIVDFLVLCFVQVFFLLVLKDGNMVGEYMFDLGLGKFLVGIMLFLELGLMVEQW